MMKRIHCIVEGQTELAVFTNILAPYILSKTGRYICYGAVKTPGGAMLSNASILV